jgi:rRNA processing protein Krr1/Pno1
MQLMPFIIGRGGNTKKQLEQETGVTLIIPKGGTWCNRQAL